MEDLVWMTMTMPEGREGVNHASIWEELLPTRDHQIQRPWRIIYARHSQETSKEDKVATAE